MTENHSSVFFCGWKTRKERCRLLHGVGSKSLLRGIIDAMRKLVFIVSLLVLCGCAVPLNPGEAALQESMESSAETKNESDLSFQSQEKESLLKEKRNAVTVLFPGLKEDHHIVSGTIQDAEWIISRNGTGILCFADAEEKATETALVMLEEENRDGTAVLYVNESMHADLSSCTKESISLPAALFVKDGRVIQVISMSCGTEKEAKDLREALSAAMTAFKKE